MLVSRVNFDSIPKKSFGNNQESKPVTAPVNSAPLSGHDTVSISAENRKPTAQEHLESAHRYLQQEYGVADTKSLEDKIQAKKAEIEGCADSIEKAQDNLKKARAFANSSMEEIRLESKIHMKYVEANSFESLLTKNMYKPNKLKSAWLKARLNASKRELKTLEAAMAKKQGTALPEGFEKFTPDREDLNRMHNDSIQKGKSVDVAHSKPRKAAFKKLWAKAKIDIKKEMTEGKPSSIELKKKLKAAKLKAKQYAEIAGNRGGMKQGAINTRSYIEQHAGEYYQGIVDKAKGTLEKANKDYSAKRLELAEMVSDLELLRKAEKNAAKAAKTIKTAPDVKPDIKPSAVVDNPTTAKKAETVAKEISKEAKGNKGKTALILLGVAAGIGIIAGLISSRNRNRQEK